MEDMDKTIEVMKAAMESEKAMKEKEKMVDQSKEEDIKMALNDEVKEELAEDMSVNTDKSVETEPETGDNETEVKDEAETEDSDGKQEKASKSLFKSSKAKEMAAKDQKIEELTDRLMRTMAEFDNYRKRSEKEKAQMFDLGVKSLVEKLLPIIDNFERGLGSLSDKEKESGFAQGIDMIYRQLMTTLEEIGVKTIEAVGQPFDPNFHNAVMHGEDENYGENIVAEEFQKGYMYHDYVVRHSMVKVVN